MAAWIKMSFGMEVGLGPGDFVLDGDPASPPKKGAKPPPQFSAHFCCGQTAGCIKMPFGTKVGLSLGDCVRWGSSPPPKNGAEPPIFGPSLLWQNGCMDQAATWYGGRPRPRRHCVRWGPNSPPQKGGGTPNFRPMSVVAKWLHGLRCHSVWR